MTPHDEFIDLACLRYNTSDRADRYQQAADLLAQHPELPEQSLYAAATAWDVPSVRRFLDADQQAHSRPGGPLDWPPLLYACYSRLPAPRRTADAVAVVELLLEAGADPNAMFLWDGTYPFTALTGAFGEGEGGPQNQPRHPEWRALAEVLLKAGADPAENQGLYNRMFFDDNEHLELLLEHGLTAEHFPADNVTGGSPAPSILGYQLGMAASRGYQARVNLLMRHGAAIDEASYGRTPWQHAIASGHAKIAKQLERAGATTHPLSPEQELVLACLSLDSGKAEQLLAADPGLVQRLPTDLLNDLRGPRRLEQLDLALKLGFPVNANSGTTPLHQAAWRGDEVLVRALLDAGADASIRDHKHDATPADWAEHAGHSELAREIAERE